MTVMAKLMKGAAQHVVQVMQTVHAVKPVFLEFVRSKQVDCAVQRMMTAHLVKCVFLGSVKHILSLLDVRQMLIVRLDSHVREVTVSNSLVFLVHCFFEIDECIRTVG